VGGRKTFGSVTWRGGVEYDLAPTSMAYATVSKGYKSGGFFATPIGGNNSYEPEKVTAFDIGIRNRFFDNTLQVNLAAFYWKYRDQQLSAIGYLSNGDRAYVTRNAGASDPRGFDADVVWKPSRADTLSLSASYTRARFKSFDINFPAAAIGFLRAGPDCTVSATPTSGPLPAYPISCAGAPLPRTPRWSGSINYQHVFDLNGGATLTSNIGTTMATGRFLTADFFIPETYDGGYVLLNADLTFVTADKKYSVTVYGRNLTKHAVYRGAFSEVLNGFFGPTQPNFVYRNIGQPRTYGVRVSAKF
jgi:iron complex outermembrane receptor protein